MRWPDRVRERSCGRAGRRPGRAQRSRRRAVERYGGRWRISDIVELSRDRASESTRIRRILRLPSCDPKHPVVDDERRERRQRHHRDRYLDQNRSALALTATDVRFHVQDLNALKASACALTCICVTQER